MQSVAETVTRTALIAALLCLAVVLALFYRSVAADSTKPSGSVQVAGSESMRPVVTACAEDFMARHPDADIIVRGGGSGDGVAALMHGIIDIGMVSRDLTHRERDFASSKDMQISMAALALDGIAVIVNGANPVAELYFSGLQDIFTGKIRNWRDLRGLDADVLPFARAEGSGTALLFGEHVLGELPYSASVRRLPTNDAIVAQIATQPAAIGYTDLGALRSGGANVKALALSAARDKEPVAPRLEEIRSLHYPLARTLNLATVGQPPSVAKAFLDHCVGANGQTLVLKAGYVASRSIPQ